MDEEIRKATIDTADIMYLTYTEFMKHTNGNKGLSIQLTGQFAAAMFKGGNQQQPTSIYNATWDNSNKEQEIYNA